jgi:hypothetical protein
MAAEEQVRSIRSAMEGKVAELRKAHTGKHQAEEQIVDLQRRILELNKPQSGDDEWDKEQASISIFRSFWKLFEKLRDNSS